MSKLYAEQDISKLAVLKSNNDTIAMKVSGKPCPSSMLNDTIAMKVSGKPCPSSMLNKTSPNWLYSSPTMTPLP
jgi:hypothetical protein